MTISELKEKYSRNELFSKDTDSNFRIELFKALFETLYENKVVIHDKFTCVARIEKVEISTDFFTAFVVPVTFIKAGTPSDKRQEKAFERLKCGWEISCKWELMEILGTSLCSSAYACWLIWCDPKIVETVEKFTEMEKYSEALKLTYFESY